MRSILIILMGSLGDVARGLTLVSPLRQAYPQARLGWLVEPACAELVRLHPQLDQVLVFERHRGLGALAKLKTQLKEFDPQLTLDLQRHAKSGFFSWLSGAPRRIGFHPRNAKEANWIFNTDYIGLIGNEVSKLLHYWEFLGKLKIPAPASALVPLDEPELSSVREAQNIEKMQPYSVVVAGSAWPSKDWPMEGYQRLIGMLAKRDGEAVVLVGDQKLKRMGQELEASHGPAVINCIGRTSLPQLVALLRGARVAIGPDSGPGHVAAMVGTPYVALFGPTSSRRTAPWGSEQLVVEATLGCRPCYRRKCPGLGTLCMRLITPEQVYERIVALHGQQVSMREPRPESQGV